MTTFDLRERAFEAVTASEQSAALSHLIHDAGMKVTAELTHQNGANAVSIAELVLAQRKAGKGLYELDSSALGATAEQLARIAVHQEERKALEAKFVAPIIDMPGIGPISDPALAGKGLRGGEPMSATIERS